MTSRKYRGRARHSHPPFERTHACQGISVLFCRSPGSRRNQWRGVRTFTHLTRRWRPRPRHLLSGSTADRFAGVEADGVVSFKGIPYAAPPVGKLRWRPPQPAQHWSVVRDATKFGPECMQTTAEVPKSKDCLTLNVLRPATSAGAAARHGLDLWVALMCTDKPRFTLRGAALAKLGVVFVSMKLSDGPARFLRPSSAARRDAQ